MSRPRPTRSSEAGLSASEESTSANAWPIRSARSPSICSGYRPRMSYALKMSGVGDALTRHAILRAASSYTPLMSGHSKWSSIKHKKAVVDSRRGAQFSKLARAIMVAARDGGGDPSANATLENAIRKAKEASMPKDNIERAIAKGTGEGGEAAAIEAVLYEGYGPGGVAVLVEALTDNRNRTTADVRHAFTKNGGNLGEPGSVAYLFDKKGTIVVDAARYSEDDLMVAVDAGAEDITTDDDVFEIVCEQAQFSSVLAALGQAGVETESAELGYRPSSLVPVDEAQAGSLMRLIEVLEDLDDVDAVHANFDVPADVLER